MAEVNGYKFELDTLKTSTCGQIGIATKGGKKYFVKRFNDPVEPAKNGSMGEATYKENLKAFELFKKRKTRVNEALRAVGVPGGNIIYPLTEVIHEHHWTEFSEHVEGALPEEKYASVINGLDAEKKLLVLKIAIGALQTIHGQRIVHGDLKLTNIMLVKNVHGNYLSKIIDFDGAYLEDDVPTDSMTGTPNYYSPEQAFYSNLDIEDRAAHTRMMTTKSDIFTMGLILHEYLAGEFPKPNSLPSKLQAMADKGKFIYPWQVLLVRDKGGPQHQLKVSRAVDKPAYVALISDMLQLDPEKRPSAAEALKRLNDLSIPVDSTGWPEDHLVISSDAVEKSYVALRKTEIKEKGKVVDKAYELVDMDGVRHIKKADELISMGLANVEDIWDEPWDEDKIELNMAKLKENFTSFGRGKEAGQYVLRDKRGSVRTLNVWMLKFMGFARSASSATPPVPPTPPKPPVPTPPTPPVPPTPSSGLWPEDAGLKVNESLLASRGIKFIGKTTMNGVNGYTFSGEGNERFLSSATAQLVKYLISK